MDKAFDGMREGAVHILSFSNGWEPGVARQVEARSTDEALQLLAGGRWCWVPDESSDVAVVADIDILMDQLEGGSPAWLIEPASGDMVHIRPMATGQAVLTPADRPGSLC